MIKAVILDFDGVILESVNIKTEAFRELFSRYTDRIEEAMKYHLEHNALSRFVKFKYLWEDLLGKAYDGKIESELGNEFSEIVFDKILKCPFVPGAEEFLDSVSQKLPIYIASASPQDELLCIVKKRGIEKYFSGIYGTPYAKKDIVIDVIRKTGAKSWQVVYIGDSVEDWKVAYETGVAFIGRRNQENLEKLDIPLYDTMDEIHAAILPGLYGEVVNKAYIKQYLKLIDDLTSRFHSRCWFSTSMAAKNIHKYKFFEELYDAVVRNKEDYTCRSYFTTASFLIKSFVRTLRLWLRISFAHIVFFQSLRKIPTEKELYIVRSGFYPSSITSDGEYKDSFFGDLPRYLDDCGKGIVIIGTVFFGNYWKILRQIRRVRPYAVFPQEYFASFLDPLRIILLILQKYPKIRHRIVFMGHDVTNIVKSYLYRDMVDYSFEQLLSFYLTRRMVRRLKVHTYIYVYENNPWQILAEDAVKRYSPQTFTIGYQHTTVSKARLNLILGEAEKRWRPVPDRIVTTGMITKDMLMRYDNFPYERVRTGCSLRFDVKNISIRPRRNGRQIKTVLVTLAAIYQSAGVFNLAYRTFKDQPSYRIIVRSHPGLPFHSMKYYLEIHPTRLSTHFILSDKNKVEDDIMRSDITLYDESSTCLTSLLMGVPVLYVGTSSIVSIDPISECRYLKRNVKDSADIIAAIEHFSSMSDETFAQEQCSARRYIESYLVPASEEAMRVFL